MEHASPQDILNSIVEDEYLSSMFFSYKRAVPFIRNKKVLDFGCGYGWGSYLMSKYAEKVMAMDIDNYRIEFAKETFNNKNITYCSGGYSLNGSFDVAIVFQVIQHVHNITETLKNIKDLMKEKGIILISTKESTKEVLIPLYAFAKNYNASILFENKYYLSEADNILEFGLRL